MGPKFIFLKISCFFQIWKKMFYIGQRGSGLHIGISLLLFLLLLCDYVAFYLMTFILLLYYFCYSLDNKCAIRCPTHIGPRMNIFNLFFQTTHSVFLILFYINFIRVQNKIFLVLETQRLKSD